MDWKKKTLLVYIIGGLVLGAAAGYLTIKNAEENNKELAPTLQDGAKVCIAALDSLKKIVLK